jgi:hypothetical protein
MNIKCAALPRPEFWRSATPLQICIDRLIKALDQSFKLRAMHWGSGRSAASKTNTKTGVVDGPFSPTAQPWQAADESSRRNGFASRALSKIPTNYDRERLETE